MDLRRFLLFLGPALGTVLVFVAILLFLGNFFLCRIVLLGAGLLAVVVPRRVFSRHEGSLRAALSVLDPEGDPTEDPCGRIQRVAAFHAEETRRVREVLDARERAVRELQNRHQKDKNKAADERKAMERRVERLTGWLNNTPGALVRVDGTGIVRWLNPGAEELLPDAIGRPAGRYLLDWKPGRSGEFVLRRKGSEVPVMVDATRPELTQGEASFLLIRDLSSERAVAAAREAAARARDRLRDVIASITPESTPRETLQGIASRIFQVVPAGEAAVTLPGEDESRNPVTWSIGRKDERARRTTPPDGARFGQVLASGQEKIVLDLRAERAGEEDDQLLAAGVAAVGYFPLTAGQGPFGVLRLGFPGGEEPSPGTIAAIHQLLPGIAHAFEGALRFQELKRGLTQWRWYLDSLPDPVVLCTPDGRIRYRNRQAAAMVPELDGEDARVERLVRQDGRGSFRSHLQHGFEKGRARFEIRLAAEGEERSGEVHMIRLDLGDERLLLLVLRDISKRKAEAAEVHRREEEAEELYRLALDLGRSLDLEWVMEQIFIKALEVTQLDFGWATLFEHETGSRTLAGCHGIDLEVVRRLYDEQGHVGFEDRVLRTKKPVVLESMSEDPTISPEDVAQSGVRSLISVPLLLEGDVVGVLNLGSSSFYQFKVQDIESLGTFGRIFARGVSNSKRYYEARRRAESYKIMLGEQRAKLKALSEEISEMQARLGTHRDLLQALGGEGGAIGALVRMGAIAARAEKGASASSRELARSVGRALTDFLQDSGAAPSPTDLERFAFALKEDDLRPAGSGESPGRNDSWVIQESLPRVWMVPAEVRRCVDVLLSGFRPLAVEPFSITVRPSSAGAALEVSFASRDHFGPTQELLESMRTLRNLPPARPGLALILLHLVGAVLARRGAEIRIVRGEGEQITLVLEFSRA